MDFGLPTSVEINGASYKINSDYRDIINICIAMSDPELSKDEKAYIALYNFYPDHESIPNESINEALAKFNDFLNCGAEESNQKQAKLVDWEQDFQYIVAPANRVVGCEIRGLDYMHWYTFMSAYMEIGGDCMFANIVRLRDLLARGKKLDKTDKEWLKRNGHLVRLKSNYTQEEDDLLSAWTNSQKDGD